MSADHGRTVFLLPINDQLERRMDTLLSPSDQRLLVRLWANQPAESISWTLDQITRRFETDADLAHTRLWLPLNQRPVLSFFSRALDRVSRPFRRRTSATAAIALEAAALAFAARKHISERQFALLTDPYRVAARMPIEVGRMAIDAHEVMRRLGDLLRQRAAQPGR